MCWSPDGTRLATGFEDGTARVWDARDGHPLLQLNGHRIAVTAVGPDAETCLDAIEALLANRFGEDE